jgi:His-Xaa-Ser system radical SAM maturase HxsC
MLLNTKGIPHLIHQPIVGKITRNRHSLDKQYLLVLENDNDSFKPTGFQAILTNYPYIIEYQTDIKLVYSIGTLSHLSEDDIVVIHPNGHINTLYRVNSFQNFLLFTERCNSNCLMCSQPPKDRDDTEYLYNIHSKLINLIPNNCLELGITGGEPTLLGNRFFRLLKQIKQTLPDTEVHCLTNGRSFAWNNLVKQLQDLEFKRLMLGIPLYSDFHQIHDYVVQAKGAFNQTMLGLYNLALIEQRIEIRIVLHKQTIPRLTKLSRFLYKNLPFAEHIAFMGLEYQGYTPHNIKELWIDPYDYMNELTESVEYLSQMGMNVSIYNSQLCVMPKELWKYNKKSISDWKNVYLDDCKLCSKTKECGGLFVSNISNHSTHIKPLS